MTDAAATITHEVKLLQAAARKVSSLFLDIKGGPYNVRGHTLAARLHAHKTPSYIVNWVLLFLSN